MRTYLAPHVALRWVLIAVIGFAFLAGGGCAAGGDGEPRMRMTVADPNPPDREFRGVFVATAYNLDWPSKPSLHRRVQRDEIAAAVAQAKELNCNVIMLQVRAFGDRIYRKTSLAADSNGKYEDEPWAQAIAYGNDPDPNETYDPLAEWISQCRAAGIELHAWVNPFRVNRLVKVTQGNKWYYLPVVKWEKQLWLRPDSKAVQDYVRAVLDDLLKNYPPATDHYYTYAAAAAEEGVEEAQMFVALATSSARSAAAAVAMADNEGPDGIIYDHYWPVPPPPPPTTFPSGRGPSHDRSLRAAMMNNTAAVITSAEKRVDWLIKVYNDPNSPHLPNDTVNISYETFLDDSFNKVKAADGKFGLSPNPDDPAVEKQLRDGQVDYVIPELYEPAAAGYDFKLKLQQWLNQIPQNVTNPPIVVAGLNTVSVQRPKDPDDDEPESADVILKQMEDAKQATGTGGRKAAGHAHYSAGALRYPEQAGPDGGSDGERNLGRKLKVGPYKAPRLAPAARRASGTRPNAPQVWTELDGTQRYAKWKKGVGSGRNPRKWQVWTFDGTDWSAPQSFGGRQREVKIGANVTHVAVQAIDKYGRASDIGRTP